MGYPDGAKGYKVLRERDGKVILRRDVMFGERPPKAGAGNRRAQVHFRQKANEELEIELGGTAASAR